MTHKLNRMMALMLAVIMTFSVLLVPVEAASFRDVGDGAWYAAAVDYVHGKGWMAGVSETSFAPNTEVTRGMFVTVLARYAEAETDNDTAAFADTTAGRWYTGAAAWAVEQGIVSGVGGNCFAPTRNITRQELCAILYKFIQKQELKISADGDRSFSDFESVSAYAREGVSFCAAAGLVSGYEDGSFRPAATATRAQLAQILMRLDLLVKGEEAPTEPMPAQSFEGEAGEDMTVSVNAPEGALPENTDMTVSRVTDEAALAAIQSKVKGQIYAAADISFSKDGTKLEPAAEVEVQIALDGLENLKNPTVVHVRDDDTVEYVAAEVISTNRSGSGKALRFYARDFSVYAVTEEMGDDVTVTVNFYVRKNGASGPSANESDWEIINRQILRKAQIESAETPFIDPGVPNLSANQSFEGWFYGSGSFSESDTGESVAEINVQAKQNIPTTDQTLNFYAMVYNVVYVVFHDQAGAVLRTTPYHVAEGTSYANAMINMTYAPYKNNQNFTGWVTAKDVVTLGDEPTFAANPDPVIPNNTVYQVTETLELYPYLQAGYWLAFDTNIDANNSANGFTDSTSADYTSPVFIPEGGTTSAPTAPTRPGYTFGGWYSDSGMKNAYSFGSELTKDTVIYAKWTPTTTTYRVVFWQQKASDAVNASTKTYDYYDSIVRNATTGQPVSITTADTQKGGTTAREMGYYFTYNSTSSNTGSYTVKGDGSTVLNVYYDRRTMTFTFRSGSSSGTTLYTRTGLYGASLNNWPSTSSTSYRWYFTHTNNTEYSLSLPWNQYVVYDNNTATTWTLYEKSFSASYNKYIHWMMMDTDGAGYTANSYTSTIGDGSSINIDSTLFLGFSLYGYNTRYNQTSGTYWNQTNSTSEPYKVEYDDIYESGSSVPYGHLYVFYNRNRWTLTYSSNNAIVKTENVYYQQNMSGFDSFVPTNGAEGYFFDGWYADPGLTTKYDFSGTMPNANVTVYAKWSLERYRVILDYTGGETGVTVTFPGGTQASTWRSDYGEKIQESAIAAARREGYLLLGWYTDPEFKNPFNFNMVMNDDIADMSYADATAAQRQGTDKVTGTAWTDVGKPEVRGKITLYAKWRQDPEGTIGVNVTYLGDHSETDTGYFNTDGQPHVWNDPELYVDRADAYAQAASVPENDNEHFLYWEILDKDGNPTGRVAYPGQTWQVRLEDAVEERVRISDPNCAHNGGSTHVEAKDPTCTEKGNVEYWSCNLCGKYFSDDELTTVLADPFTDALGHDWGEWINTQASGHYHTCSRCNTRAGGAHVMEQTAYTAPTTTSTGSRTETCSVCGYSVTTVLPMVEGYTVHFSVPAGVTAPTDLTGLEEGAAVTLPTAPAPEGYTFLGWVESDVAETTTAPEYYANSFTVTDNVTLHALYSFDSTEEKYVFELLSSLPDTITGSYYAITSGTSESDYLMSATNGTYYNNANGSIKISDAGAKIVDASPKYMEDVPLTNFFYFSTVTDYTNYYALRSYSYSDTENSIYYYVCDSSSGLTTSTTLTKSGIWSLTASSGKFAIASNNYPSYKINFGGTYFDTSTSSSAGVYLWQRVLKSVTTTAYTTIISGGETPDPAEGYTVTYYADGQLVTAFPVDAGTSITVGQDASGNTLTTPTMSNGTFVGWVSQQYSGETTQPTLASGTVTVNSSLTYYALFSQSGNSNIYTLFTDELSEGDYLIVYDGAAMNSTLSSNRLQYETVTISNNAITTDNAAIVWHIAPNNTDYWTLYNASVEMYAGEGTQNNRMRLSATVASDYYRYSVTKSGNTFDFVGQGLRRYLRKNDTYGFAAYASTTGGPLSLYKKSSGTVYTTGTAVSGNAVTEPVELADILAAKESKTRIAELDETAVSGNRSVTTQNPFGATTGTWVETDTITVGEEYLIGVKYNDTVYLLMNANPTTNNYYYSYAYDSDTTYYLGYVATATLDTAGNIVGVTGDTTDFDYCTWNFSSTTGGTITSCQNSARYLYGSDGPIPYTSATTYTWDASAHALTENYTSSGTTTTYYVSIVSVSDAIYSYERTSQLSGAGVYLYKKQDTSLDDALNVEGGTLHFTSGGSYPWTVPSGESYAQSGNYHVSSSTSDLALTLEMAAGDTLSFKYWFSTESSYDYFLFYSNGVATTADASGSGSTSDWQTYTFTAESAGTYNFVWRYSKDSSTNSGSDCCRLDDVEYTPNVTKYTLTIHYQFADGTQADEDYVGQYAAGAVYSVTSPVITGYTANYPIVSGTMPSGDHSRTVVYTANTVSNERWEPTQTIVPGEDYLIAYVLNGTPYLLVNYNVSEENHYSYDLEVTSSSGTSTATLGYLAPATVVTENGTEYVSGVNGAATDLQYCHWIFSDANGGTITSGYESGRSLYWNGLLAGTAGVSPQTSGDTWVWVPNSTGNMGAMRNTYTSSSGTSYTFYFYPRTATGAESTTTTAPYAGVSQTSFTNVRLYHKVVTQDTTWTVSFVDEDGVSMADEGYPSYETTEGSTVTRPADPEREDYYFLGWYYINSEGREVQYNFGDEVHGDLTLIAHFLYAWEVQYTITLRAVYGIPNTTGRTFIYWYANDGTDYGHGVGAGDRFEMLEMDQNVAYNIPTPNGAVPSSGSPANMGWTGGSQYYHDAQGNAAVSFVRNDATYKATLEASDRVFLGWARIPVPPGESGTVGTAHPELTEDDLYLKWTGAKYQYKNDQGVWTDLPTGTVGEVYATDDASYHDMYAVWSSYAYVFHSSSGKIEAIEVTKTKSGTAITTDTVNLVDMVPSGYLYGGYYTTYGGASAISDESMRSFKNTAMANAFSVDHNSGTADKLVSTGAETYDGSAVKTQNLSTNVRFWTRANAYGVGDQAEAPAGMKLVPEVGTVYYLKEVPEAYLAAKYIYTYDTAANNVIRDFYMLTLVDDNLYRDVGFRTMPGAETVEEAAAAELSSRQSLAGYFSITQSGSSDGSTQPVTLTVDASSFGLSSGFVAFRKESSLVTPNGSFTLMPGWTTLDGVDVNSRGTLKLDVNAEKTAITAALLGTLPVVYSMIYVNTAAPVLNETDHTVWETAGAVTKFYFFGDSGSSWVTAAKVDTNLYSCEIPSGSWSGVIVVRCAAGSENTHSWDNKWDQTADIALDRSKNLITIDNYIIWDGGSKTYRAAFTGVYNP